MAAPQPSASYKSSCMTIDMKAATILALVFAAALGLLAVPQISDVQDQGESLGNNVGGLISNVTAMTVVLMVTVVVGGLLMAGWVIWSRLR